MSPNDPGCVKLLFDQKLSPRLVARLRDVYAGSTHVRDVGLERADDSTVWQYAAEQGFTIISKTITPHEERSMHLYVELWKARPKWLELSAEERGQYFDKIGPEIQKLTDAGVEIVGFALNDQETPHRSDYRYLAVWKMPHLAQVEMLESSVQQAGWHEYFEQENARGELISPPQALEDMAKLS